MFGLSLSRSRYSREMRSSMRFLMTLKSGCAKVDDSHSVSGQCRRGVPDLTRVFPQTLHDSNIAVIAISDTELH